MKEKYFLLDGLRGLAALSVVMYHADVTAQKTPLFAHGYLAVDFFFMLSGFVIAHNYQERLDKSWPSIEFFKVRLLRLYPLYLLGLLCGALGLILKNHETHTGTSIQNLAGVVGLGALLLPVPQFVRHGVHGAFPLNYPAWSLFAEAAANIAHAFFFRNRSNVFIAMCLALSIAVTGVITVQFHGLSFGVFSNEIPLAIPRVLMSYLAGILIYRFWLVRKPGLATPGWAVCGLLMLMLLTPRLGGWNASYDLAAVLVVFPTLLFAGVSAKSVTPVFRYLCDYAGKSSYAIYILHIPVLAIAIEILETMHQQSLETRVWTNAIFPLLALAVATAAYKVYDEPVRKAFKMIRPYASRQEIGASAASTL